MGFSIVAFIISGLLIIFGIYAILNDKEKIVKILSFIFAGISMITGVISCINTAKPIDDSTVSTSNDTTSDASSSEPTVENISFDTANEVHLDKDISGDFSTNQKLYYSFVLSEQTAFSIYFKHNIIDDSSDFCSYSIYEDSDTENAIISESISNNIAENTFGKIRKPQGKYYIVFELETSNNTDSSFTFNVVTYDSPSNCEFEINDTITSATNISTDTEIYGNSENSSDLDYYTFTIDNPSRVYIKFKYNMYDTSDTFWDISIFSEQSTDEITSFSAEGGNTESYSKTINLSDADVHKYYIKVEPKYSTPSDDYILFINTEALKNTKSNSSEIEPNNSIESSTQISLNKKIDGNSQSNEDIDYYKLNIKGNKVIKIQFEHPFYDNSDDYWEIEFLSENNSVDFPEMYICGNDKMSTSNKIRISSGTYYVKITPSYPYSDDTYYLKVVSE